MNKNGFRSIAEGFFLIYLLYSLVSVNLGIYLPYLAGIMLAISAFASILLGLNKWPRSPIFILICLIALICILIQLGVFNLGLSSEYVRIFYFWIVTAIVTLPFAGNEQFLKRIAIVIAISIIVQIPFLFAPEDGILRYRFISGSTGIDNANDLADWLGFCFIVMWMWIWKTSRKVNKIILSLIDFVIFAVILETVSRGALLAIVLAVLIFVYWIERKKRLFYVLFLAMIAGAFVFIEPLQNLLFNYETRLTIDTGRFELLEIGIEQLKTVPFWGIGADNIFFQISSYTTTTPHNPFLVVGLSSGIIPLILFFILWLLVIKSLFQKNGDKYREIIKLPLFVFIFITSFISNGIFTSVWVVSSMVFIESNQITKTSERNFNILNEIRNEV